MVKSISKHIDEVSGRLYDTPKEALESETKSKCIRDAFCFYVAPEEVGCDFMNGNYCIQRNEEFYNKMLDTLICMIEKHEPWISERFRMNGAQLSRESVGGYSFVGRLLDDNNSQLYKWWNIQCCICQKCFREYGQPYYALHCQHDDTILAR